eukprot:UN07176
MADNWLRSLLPFYFPIQQNLYQSIILHIMDQPNILCILIDKWNEKRDQWWKSQRRDCEQGTNEFIKEQFKELLLKFLPVLIHQTIINQPLPSLDQPRLNLIQQIISGDIKQTLLGNKPTPSAPIIYSPFSTDMFVF